MAPDTATRIHHGPDGSAIVFARLTGLFAVVVGVAVLVGWYLDEPLLKQGFPNSLTIKANAAVGFVLAGVGLLALTYAGSRPLARLFGLMLIAGAGATLSQTVFRWDLGIDQFLFAELPGRSDTAWPGRMSLGSALSFTLIGCVLVLTARQMRALKLVTEVMLVMILVLAITNLIGHSYEITQLYNPFPLTAMPIQKSIMLALIAAGLSAACPDRGFARALTDSSAGGQMIRRLLPGIIVFPIVLGWFVHRGLVKDIYSVAAGTAMFAVSTIVVMAWFTWLTSVALRRSDQERQEALVALHGQRESLRTTLVSIADAVMATNHAGSILIMNPVAERLTGWTLAAAHGSTIREVFRIIDEVTHHPVEDPTVAAQRENKVVALADSLLIRKDGTALPVEYTASPILSRNGRVAGAVLIFRDITERRRAEEQQKMLVGELNHRVRNMLMVVQSLVQASAQFTDGKSAEEMSKVLAERLQSLSRAHELLLDTHWKGASLKRMVELELDPFRHEGTRKIAIRGRDVLLPPQCTSVVAMALHELTTNAAKYGALATRDGRLDVRWTTRSSSLTINWVESHIEMGTQRAAGFGMRLIDKGIRQNLGGDTRLEFMEDGLAVTLRIPLSVRSTPRRQQASQPQPA